MPSWSIHLTVANKVNKEINTELDSFLYGNLLPDVDHNSKINRYVAHYYNDNLPFKKCPKAKQIDINNFLKDYSNNIKNPLILGYYCHLLTDNYYNNIVCSNYWIQNNNNDIIGIKLKTGKIKKIDIKDTKNLKKKYKHKDFELYGKYLYNSQNFIPILNKNKIIKNIPYIKNNFLTEELVNQRLNYLDTKFKTFNKLSLKEKIFKHKYHMFYKKELDIILDGCVKYIIKEIKKLN